MEESIAANQNLSVEELAPWRSHLSRALHRNRAVPFCRYLQLATIRANGTPANRTVVFRGFLSDTNQLLFISDRRSEKTAQIQQNPNAEACWYFTKTREQFRLTGQLRLVTHSSTHTELVAARTNTWQKLSDNARSQFYWPHPKEAKAGPEAFEPQAANGTHNKAEKKAEKQPPASFTLLCLRVTQVDHLELRGNPQDRHLYAKAGSGIEQWHVSHINP